MPDITMCKGDDCKLKDHCYRYKAEPNEYRQSYFAEIPYKNGKCDYYSCWELRNENKRRDK